MGRRLAHLAARTLLGAALGLALAGCWNRREVNEVALVSAAAIDRTPEGRTRVTIQLIKPAALAGGGDQAPGAGGPRAIFKVAATGNTLFEAVRHLNHYVPRKPEWNHNNVIVFSEEVARSGVGDLLDFFLRDHEARLDQWILVARGQEAAAALDAHWELEPNSGVAMRLIYRRGAINTGEIAPVRLYDFMLALTSPTRAPLAAVIRPFLPGEERAGLETRPGTTWRIGEAAVFRKDRLAGWLSDREVRGLQWLRGKVVSGIIRVPCQNPPGEGIGVEILGSRARLVPEWRAGELPAVRVPIRVFGKLGDLMCRDDVARPGPFARLAERTAGVVLAEAEATLRRLQRELGADPLGIGEALHRAFPREFKGWKERWDEVYPRVRVIPEVTVELSQTGISVGKPVPRAPGGGGAGEEP